MSVMNNNHFWMWEEPSRFKDALPSEIHNEQSLYSLSKCETIKLKEHFILVNFTCTNCILVFKFYITFHSHNLELISYNLIPRWSYCWLLFIQYSISIKLLLLLLLCCYTSFLRCVRIAYEFEHALPHDLIQWLNLWLFVNRVYKFL